MTRRTGRAESDAPRATPDSANISIARPDKPRDPTRQRGIGRRVLICSAGIPHETRGASTVLFFHYVAHLRAAGYQILHLLLLEGDAWPNEELGAYERKVAELGRFEVLACRASRFVDQGRTKHQLREAAIQPARGKADAFAPDLILAFDLLAAWVTASVTAERRVVWLGDLNFQTIWYHALYAVQENKRALIHVPSNWLLCRTWKRIYIDVLRHADTVIVASHSSVAELASLGITAEYEPYPWPSLNPPAAGTGIVPPLPTFLFFGTLTGLGSRSALHFTLTRLFPALREVWGAYGFRVLLAGRGEIPVWARGMMEDKPEFQQLGFVDDLSALMSRCHGVLVPIDVPVGNRSRILTAMAGRALIIAHANTAFGNPDLVDGQTCYLAANVADFVVRMRRAVDDRTAAHEIVERAYACWRDHFRPEAAAARLAARITDLLETSSTSAPPPGHGSPYIIRNERMDR
jgi:glycosyltransferase involved in cell wall biosynthesis